MQVIKMRERVLGLEHPDTLISINNLAWIWKSQGCGCEAVKLMAEYVQLQEQMVGVEHPLFYAERIIVS